MWQCWHIQGQQDAQEILGEQGLLQWLSLQGCFTAQGCGNPPRAFSWAAPPTCSCLLKIILKNNPTLQN